MQQHDYGRAIDLLMSGNVDYKAVAIALAKADPGKFIQLATTMPSPRDVKAVDIIRHIMSRDKVKGIKALRDVYMLGLKEAKDICDNLQDALATRYPDKISPYSSGDCLANALYNDLLEIYEHVLSNAHFA